MPTPLKSSRRRRSYTSPSSSIIMVMRLMAFFTVPLVLSCLVVTFSSSCTQLDKDSLLDFYNNISTEPHPPLNWFSSVDCCSWEGILCDESNMGNGDHRVIGLLLPSRGLSGSISPALTNLTGLSQLNLSQNRLSGNLPTQFISLLSHLQIIDLSYNRLSDELPASVVNNNNETSSIIQELDLSSNLFQGTLPSSFLQYLGAATAAGTLTSFNVSNNSFIGPIPISHITTELVGTLGYIPPEYGQASEATLRGDVYSFGILMLELITGRRPLDMCKTKMPKEQVLWMQQMRSEGKQDQVFDPLLRGKGFEEEVLQVFDVACMCVSQNPFKRPSIREVADWLKNVGSAKQHQNED